MQVVIAKVHALDVDTAKFAQEVNDYIYAYGLKQILNDAGSAGKSPDEKLAMAQKKLDGLYEGTLRVRREAAEAADPITAEAVRLCKAAIRQAKGAKAFKEMTEEYLARLIEKNVDKFRPQAEKILAAKREAASGLEL